ncbi:MAG: hypothetical protein KJO69_08025 [Gammaproteobacteria bacterium]|nr:hypothetical protein [Gammaproteobacteria bacterium]NNJ73522.1 hypothetical protein [Enterobacterales bacterium]
MIFAKIIYSDHSEEIHQPLVDCLQEKYPDLQCGHQGDSWIWITEGDQKVEIDTFYAMYHEVRSATDSPLVWSVLEQLDADFDLVIIDPPEEDPADTLYE